MIEIEDYGTTIMAHNIPDEADAYSMLNYCDNVEREGTGSYRFEGLTESGKAMLVQAIENLETN
jgi:hypothetical protein